ncbi:TonB-dependent receptor [Roseateles oligotrophus]|uniref:TonB-dependent receptor n=1 Tax=Roseateles oligotrophus TaxID=1769250 RepID=A0ABT2YJY3_9BURK|nr:TonB-dependent receptor [Roseateles oligotrophus]MCV2370365.1 TonB-dependent receptor [Roseateles oligotrophus]
MNTEIFLKRKQRLAAALLSLSGLNTALAEPELTATEQLAPVLLSGNYINAVGSSDAASQGSVSAKLLQSRPTLRPAEVLEFVPGVIITQHSGDGKANQYFLRGFNLDHGTDFATYVAGMPVNMPTHAHGHGYSDLNWLIPELVSRIDYKKGPYYAEEGDFSSAGAAHIGLFDRLDKGVLAATLGQFGYRRGLLAKSLELQGGRLLYAVEAARNDGPWENPEDFRRFNSVLRYSIANEQGRSAITAMAYSADWNASDQLPLRAVQSGLIGRFGTVDPSDGGRTARYSLSFEHERSDAEGGFKLNAYAIRSRLNLFSNFSYFLDKPVDLDPTAWHGDQFEQAEQRQVYGLNSSRHWNGELAGLESGTRLGLQLRHDRLAPVGLYASVARERVATTQESRTRQTTLGLYAETSLQWTPWLRSVAGLRADHFDFDVNSSIAANSGKNSANIVSPKLSLVFGPWSKTEYFLNYGHGFHSNDARGVTATVTAKEGLPAASVDALVRSKGAELGLRSEIIPGLQSSLALWQLRLDSELVFVGDAGDTEPSRASRRQGLEWNNHYIAASWLLLDADISWSRARFTDADPAGPYVPGAISKVLSLGATVTDLGPWFGHFQLRYMGPRALIEDNSQRSNATTLAYARIGYKFGRDSRLTLDLFNLFNRQASDIDYFYASRLKGEAAEGVADRHFHPVEPRSLRLTWNSGF